MAYEIEPLIVRWVGFHPHLHDPLRPARNLQTGPLNFCMKKGAFQSSWFENTFHGTTATYPTLGSSENH